MRVDNNSWKRHGLIWSSSPDGEWTTGDAMVPTPVVLDERTVRIFVSCRDSDGRARPFSFDMDLSERPRLIENCSQPLLQLGEPGTFDQDGVMCTSLVPTSGGQLLMYYSGFERLNSIRYRIMVGLASSLDGGMSFERVSQTPILDRAPGELFFRGGPFVRLAETGYEMLYAGGSSWTIGGGKILPAYDLRLAKSQDGFVWDFPTRIVIPINERNFGYGRPWIHETTNDETTVFVSIRDSKTSTYRMGIARFGLGWNLNSIDYGMGLEPTGIGNESRQTIFAATVKVAGRTWCFYNGDELGRHGVLLAERKSK